MRTNPTFIEQIREVIRDNGWDGQLDVIPEAPSGAPGAAQVVRVHLGKGHLTAAGDLVNIYIENVHPLEQVQQECLRALRTGRSGL